MISDFKESFLCVKNLFEEFLFLAKLAQSLLGAVLQTGDAIGVGRLVVDSGASRVQGQEVPSGICAPLTEHLASGFSLEARPPRKSCFPVCRMKVPGA